MKFAFRGALRGRLAKEFEEPLDNVRVRLYDAQQTALGEEAIEKAAAARPKETFSFLSPDEVEQKQDSLIAEGTTETDGSFSIDIDESAEFTEDKQGRPDIFQVDVRVETIPRTRAEVEDPVQFTLTMHDPSWEPAEPGAGTQPDETTGDGVTEVEEETQLQVAEYNELIPKKNWCAALEKAGIWVVCGRVTVKNTTAPVRDMTVTARDADIIQHEELGSDVTDSNGEFSIYYTQADFEETPPPWGPIELVPGPDLYFRVEHGGTTYLDEDTDKGREAGRENADHCEYVELSISPPDRDEEEDSITVPTYWRRVGSAFDVPFIFPGTSDFDADGYAGNKKYALHRTITMEGSAPLLHSVTPDEFVQYRFLVAQDPTSSSPSYQPVGVGSATYRDAFADGLVIGEILAYDASNASLRPIPVEISKAHLDGKGWLDVRQAANDALNSALGTDLATLRSNDYYFGWNDSDPLMGIDTRQFTTEPDVRDASVSDPVPSAGDPVPTSREIDVEKIGIKFEARVVDDSGSRVSSTPKQVLSGTELSPVVVNNNREFVEFENVAQAANKCEILTGDVNLAYTVHHPHLEQVNINVRRNDGTSESLDDPDNEIPLDASYVTGGGNISNIREFNDGSLKILDSDDAGSTLDDNRSDDPILTKSCAYEVSLRTERRLHNGYSSDDPDTTGNSLFYWKQGGGGSP